MTALEKFKKFRDNDLAKLAGGRKGHYIFNNKVCEAIVSANPITLSDLGEVSGIKKGSKNFELFGEAIVKYFTTSNNF